MYRLSASPAGPYDVCSANLPESANKKTIMRLMPPGVETDHVLRRDKRAERDGRRKVAAIFAWGCVHYLMTVAEKAESDAFREWRALTEQERHKTRAH